MRRMNWMHLGLSVLLAAGLAGCRGNTPPSETPSSGTQNGAPATAASGGSSARAVPPRPAPAPREVVRTVPAGVVIPIELSQTVASNINHAGDRFEGRVPRDVTVGSDVVSPAGSTVAGVVTEARHLRKIGGRARLGLDFVSIDPPTGPPAPMKASYLSVGKSETTKDAATIGGAAVGGAILGRIIGHKKGNEARGTAIGGAVGAATGTAIAASTKGKEIVLPAGQSIRVTLQTPIRLTLNG